MNFKIPQLTEVLGERTDNHHSGTPNYLSWVAQFEEETLTREAELREKHTSVMLEMLRTNILQRECSQWSTDHSALNHTRDRDLWPSETPVSIVELLQIARMIPLKGIVR